MPDVASVAEMPASGVDDINSLLDLPLMGRSILESMCFGGVPREGMCVEQLHTWVLAMGDALHDDVFAIFARACEVGELELAEHLL